MIATIPLLSVTTGINAKDQYCATRAKQDTHIVVGKNELFHDSFPPFFSRGFPKRTPLAYQVELVQKTRTTLHVLKSTRRYWYVMAICFIASTSFLFKGISYWLFLAIVQECVSLLQEQAVRARTD